MFLYIFIIFKVFFSFSPSSLVFLQLTSKCVRDFSVNLQPDSFLNWISNYKIYIILNVIYIMRMCVYIHR